MCLASAQLQQEAMERHPLEARPAEEAEPEEGAVDGAEEEEAEAAGLEAPAEALEQMLQVCEQDMSATDVALSESRGEEVLAGKRKREEELADQPVRHSLWEQGSLEALNEVLFGCLDGEVWAMRQRKANYDEAGRLSDGGDSCWSNSGNDSDREAELEVDIAPIALEGAVVRVAQGGEEEGAAGELAGKGKR